MALFLWAAGAEPGQAADAPPPNEITVISAVWGAGKRTVDVTSRMSDLVHPLSGNITVNANTLQVDDPAPGMVKQLIVTYRYHGSISVLTFKEGGVFYYLRFVRNATAGKAPAAGGAADTPAAVEAPTGPQILTEEQMAGIVLIEGDKGVATGFIANVHDTVCVVTNLHVLGDNEKFTIRTLGGDVVGVSVQGIIGAVGADIALLRLTDPSTAPPTMGLAENVLKSAKIGDEVVVVGNRLGGGVATQTVGKIKGVGPSRVEVDAPFQPGNSGSPIFDRTSSQVVGVAAYAETVPLDALGNPATSSSTVLKRETRWFGYRLDSVTKWESIDWPKWRSQITQVEAYRATSLALLALLQGNLVGAKEDSKLKRIVAQYQVAAAPLARGSAAQAVQIRTLLAQARTVGQETANDLSGSFYDYFRTSLYWETSVPDQTKFREMLLKALTEADGNLSAALRGSK